MTSSRSPATLPEKTARKCLDKNLSKSSQEKTLATAESGVHKETKSLVVPDMPSTAESAPTSPV